MKLTDSIGEPAICEFCRGEDFYYSNFNSKNIKDGNKYIACTNCGTCVDIIEYPKYNEKYQWRFLPEDFCNRPYERYDYVIYLDYDFKRGLHSAKIGFISELSEDSCTVNGYTRDRKVLIINITPPAFIRIKNEKKWQETKINSTRDIIRVFP